MKVTLTDAIIQVDGSTGPTQEQSCVHKKVNCWDT